MKNVLIFAETVESQLSPLCAEALTIARSVADQGGGQVSALLIGADVTGQAAGLGNLGADQVFVADAPALAQYEGEAFLAALESSIQIAEPDLVLLGQTLNGRDLAARLAFRLGAPLVTDCTALRIEDGNLIMTKPVYGGNATAEYTAPEAALIVATTRPRAFEAAEQPAVRKAAIHQLTVEGSSRVRYLETVAEAASAGPRLKDAKVVVSGGRGIGGPENWHVIEELAAPLGAAVGATRAVTDAGWVAPSLQVGLTGITITPDLYVTVAVSGAVQHIAGCSGARNIVAINKDPEANIFKHARYGVVGDWKQVLPALTAKVKELRGA